MTVGGPESRVEDCGEKEEPRERKERRTAGRTYSTDSNDSGGRIE